MSAVTTAAITNDLPRPVAPRADRKGPRPLDRRCELCGDRRLYLVRERLGVLLKDYLLCSECSSQYAAARAEGRVP